MGGEWGEGKGGEGREVAGGQGQKFLWGTGCSNSSDGQRTRITVVVESYSFLRIISVVVVDSL